MAEYIERDKILGYMDLVVIHARGVAGNDSILKKVTDIVENMRDLVAEAPAADVVPVCRCKDCIHYDMRSKESGYCYFWDHEQGMEPNRVVYDDFCSYGERKGGE